MIPITNISLFYDNSTGVIIENQKLSTKRESNLNKFSAFYGMIKFEMERDLQRVRFRVFWVMDYSCAWDPAILGRWTVPTREILRFLGDGPFQQKASFFWSF